MFFTINSSTIKNSVTLINEKSADNSGGGTSEAAITVTVEPGVYICVASQQTATYVNANIIFSTAKGEIIGHYYNTSKTSDIVVFKVTEKGSVICKAICSKDNWCYSSCILLSV